MLILQTTPSSYCRDKIILIDHRRFIPTQQYNSRPKRKIDGQHKPRLLNLSIICSSNDRIKYSNRLGMISISRIVSVTATLIASLSLASAIMGGWREVPVDNPDVLLSTRFAVGSALPAEPAAEFKVLSAKAQVVAGMKYDVVANVYTAAGCRKMEFEVWDRFGARTLNSFENLGDC